MAKSWGRSQEGSSSSREQHIPENAGRWKRPGIQIRKALEVEERKPQERSTGRDQQRHTWALGECGDDAGRVGRDESVTMQCLLKESELHSVENAETLRRDTVRADSGR